MSGTKVTAAFQSELSQVESIVYLPEGKHQISASKGGKPAVLTVEVNESILASFREQLKERQESNVRPFAGFDHKTGAASFIPQEFRYESGVGLVLDVEWTQAGRAAIDGKDYSYFSPTFLVDDNGTPIGLPKRGEIGSLVNDPAFEEIPRIAASHTEPNKRNLMIEHLIELGLVEAGHDEAAALATAKTKIEALRAEALKASTVSASHSELADKLVKAESKAAELETQVTDLQGKIETAAEASADAAVTEAVNAGRIAPQDEDAKAFWKASIKANPDSVKVLNAIPAKRVPQTVIAGRTDKQVKEELTGIQRAIAAHKNK